MGRQVGRVQFACSSEPSPQSSSRSQRNRSGTHRVLLQENLSAPQPGAEVAVNDSEIQSTFKSLLYNLVLIFQYCSIRLVSQASPVGVKRKDVPE